MIAVTLTALALCMVGAFLLFLGCIPLVYAYMYAQKEIDKETITNNLKIARTNKIHADQEVLESRRALIDSNVAIKELQAEERRRKLGYPPANDKYGNPSFTPTNYETNHD